MPAQNPVVVVPGITGSSLRDRYPIDPDTVWSLLQRDELRVTGDWSVATAGRVICGLGPTDTGFAGPFKDVTWR